MKDQGLWNRSFKGEREPWNGLQNRTEISKLQPKAVTWEHWELDSDLRPRKKKKKFSHWVENNPYSWLATHCNKLKLKMLRYHEDSVDCVWVESLHWHFKKQDLYRFGILWCWSKGVAKSNYRNRRKRDLTVLSNDVSVVTVVCDILAFWHFDEGDIALHLDSPQVRSHQKRPPSMQVLCL